LRIIDLMSRDKKFLSLEFFPPKDRAMWPGFFQAVERLKAVNPLFVSVTYGAGGTTRDLTLELVSVLKKDYDLEPMAHLTCVGASAEYLKDFLNDLDAADVQNVMALRGDPPQGEAKFVPDSEEFQHASDLVRFIREQQAGFGIAVAGYPEVHPESRDPEDDMHWFKYKLDAGGDFAVTQLFFDNEFYFDFMNRAQNAGITKPIIPGILPVYSLAGLKRIRQLCGAYVPPDYLASLEQADAEGGTKAVSKLGVEFAKKQIRDLLDRGAPGVHLYTLNRSAACLELAAQLDL